MQKEVKIWYLKNYNLFADLDEKQMADLIHISRFKRFKKGSNIFYTGENDRMLYFLIDGRIKICEEDQDGNELIKEIVKEGDLFGELLVQDQPKKDEYAAVLSSEVMLCVFSLNDFELLMGRNPSLALNFTRKVWSKYRESENRYANLAFMDVKSRLIHFFKAWATEEGERQGSSVVLKNYLTHSDIANLICTSRQSVTTILNELKDTGHFAYSRKEIVIRDLNILN